MSSQQVAGTTQQVGPERVLSEIARELRAEGTVVSPHVVAPPDTPSIALPAPQRSLSRGEGSGSRRVRRGGRAARGGDRDGVGGRPPGAAGRGGRLNRIRRPRGLLRPPHRQASASRLADAADSTNGARGDGALARPDPPGYFEGESMTRRRALTVGVQGIGGLAAAGVALPAIAFAIAP